MGEAPDVQDLPEPVIVVDSHEDDESGHPDALPHLPVHTGEVPPDQGDAGKP